ncbi:ParA family protein [Corallococcus sp. CA053C]|uniref:ParA family protein n=1 Tax=Corallococcus sp. CA053C TaxID=2316732 RepID=UPI000EA26DA8|nr:AAA family ATPase [Corallococcus sp. CA053C]RKG97008.1 ParA family protein [Corallococcus sp. CA053C]
MRIVSVMNYKGGVGKTSLTSNLGAELAWRGFKVLLLDMDPQTSLTFSFFSPEEWEKDLAKDRTIKDWFSGSPPPLGNLIVEPTRSASILAGRGCLHLIASHLGLVNVDLELATGMGGATLTQVKQKYVSVHRRLADGLAQIPQGAYDIILIDCPPNFNIVTKTAIVASQYVVIPAKPDYLSTLGIDYLRRSVAGLIKDFNEFAGMAEGAPVSKINPLFAGVVFTMIQEYNGQPIAALRPFINQTRNLGVPVFDSYIKENKTLFADAPQYGVPVVLRQRANKTQQSVIDGLESFTTEFSTKLGLMAPGMTV